MWGGREKYGPNLFYLFGLALFAIATTPSYGHPSSPEEGTTLDVAPLYLEGQALRARNRPPLSNFFRVILKSLFVSLSNFLVSFIP